MYHIIKLKTRQRNEFIDITEQVSEFIQKNKIEDGSIIIYIPHTTAAIIVNENCDHSVVDDIQKTMNQLVPCNHSYSHTEGNADAHIKSAIIGSSRTLFFENKKLLLGTWQGIFFCEFDGPRDRKVYIKLIPDKSINLVLN